MEGLSYLNMHSCPQSSFRNFFVYPFPRTHFIKKFQSLQKPLFSSSFRSVKAYTEAELRSRTYTPTKSLWAKEKLRWYSEKLRECTEKRSVDEGRAIHGEIIESGIEMDSHLWASLINFYAKCGCLSVARQVFEGMPDKDVVSWTALIGGFVADGYSDEGLRLFCNMLEEGVSPNGYTLATVLKACSMCLNGEFGKQVHGVITKFGLFPDVHVRSSLVDLYAKCGELQYAEKLCLFMPQQDVVSWNSLLNGFAQVGNDEQVLQLFCKMIESEMKFNKHTLCTILKGCTGSGNLKAGQLVHGISIKIACVDDEFVSCSLVDMYAKCGLADDAFVVFSRMKSPDIVTCSAMISCLERQGREHKAVELFLVMISLGLRPNQVMLASIASAAKDLGDLCFSQSIHAYVYKYGFGTETLVSNALIKMYMKIGSVNDGFKIFNAMNHRDLFSWNTILSGLHDGDCCFKGPQIFKEILAHDLKPNMYTFISTLRSCTSLSNLKFGKQVHAQIIKFSLHGDCYVGTALIDMYAKSKCMEDAEKIGDRLNKKDLFTWTVIIAGLAQIDEGEKAIHYFNQMRKEGVKPNEFTLAGCLGGCSRMASLESGRQLHSLAIKDGHFGDTYVATALIDMYGKCGCIDESEMIFEALESDDAVLWNTIICQYSQHGKGEKALQAFECMLAKGALPDGVTFIGVLSACSRLGLIDVGRKHFYSISEVYGIPLSVEHYACMVDILGRAGKFTEVENLIEQMNVTPNHLIWETVLGACKVHGNADLGQRVAEKLFQIEPEVDSNYVMLSNILAAKGMWVDVARVRGLMSREGIKKEPGCSWVEVDARTHVFLSQDTSHPRTLEIHQMLQELEVKLLSVGYIPNTDYALQNVSDREKRKNLSHHSERLALAFSFINSNSNSTVRIFKNLRICGDCHEYMKFVSKITKKHIVIRDARLFHHFQEGACSCHDYW